MPTAADVVVLDPPRTGAGRGVCAEIAALRPRVIVYVACDPAALARDTAYLAELGLPAGRLRAFDAFPMTHHVECVASRSLADLDVDREVPCRAPRLARGSARRRHRLDANRPRCG